MTFTRRGFIAGVSALLAAPAIVRPGLLMPVRSFIIAKPIVSLLTPSMITKEALIQFQKRLATPRLNAHQPASIGPSQVHVDFHHTSHDLALPLRDFTERYIKPAVYALADAVSPTSKFVAEHMPLPADVDFAANERYNGISMRLVRAYDIENDAFVSRLDVRTA